MRRLWLLVALFILFAVLFNPFHSFSNLKNASWRLISSPNYQGLALAQKIRSVVDLVRSIRQLHDENSQLKADNLRLEAELQKLQDTSHENDVLRKELGVDAGQRSQFDLLPTAIVGRSPSTFLQFIVLGAGSNDGVQVNEAVTSQGFLIGRVVETTASTAKVELITASRSLIPITSSQSRATGLLKGGLAGLTGEEFPADSKLIPGEQLISSNLGDFLPAGIPIGTIDHVLTLPSDFVQRVSINSPIEFGKLEIVVILKKKN